MKGDFSRSTFKPKRHYSGVRMQQGRVQLDADWNEQIDIQAHRDETAGMDVIGPSGAPSDNPGFEITPEGNNIKIGQGRYYVDGILCENENGVYLAGQSEQPDRQEQPDLPGTSFPMEEGDYLVYLDVWQRHITPLEDPDIREVALGGPDTATRTKTVWQVKLLSMASMPPDAHSLTGFSEWDDLITPPNGQLRARSKPGQVSSALQAIAVGEGYQRLENQLYRVEIHRGGGPGEATFKWSRDNGSIVTRWSDQSRSGSVLTVGSLGRDQMLGFAPGQWVELTDDDRELWSEPGTMVKVKAVGERGLTIGPADEGRICLMDNEAQQSSTSLSLSSNVTEIKLPTFVVRKEGFTGVPTIRRPQIQLLVSDVPLIQAADDVFATLGSDLNELTLIDGKLNDGDTIEITGSLPDSAPVNGIFTYGKDNNGTTVQHLIDVINSVFTVGATATLGRMPKLADFGINPKVRRWDFTEPLDSMTVCVPEENEGWIELEDGVEIQFEPGNYRTGDYWLIPARTFDADIEWPKDGNGNPESLLPHGIGHHYARLGLVKYTADKFSPPKDWRRLFSAATDLELRYISGDGQEAMPGHSLPQSLRVGVFVGKNPIEGVKVRFTITQPAAEDSPLGALEASDTTGTFLELTTDSDGLAACTWCLPAYYDAEEKSTLHQLQVEATLMDVDNNPMDVPIRFSASFSLAETVAYDTTNDDPLHQLPKPLTTQDALDDLRGNAALYYVSGDGQERKPGQILPKPLQVRVANGHWPVNDEEVTFSVVSRSGVLIPSISSSQSPSKEATLVARTLKVRTDEEGMAICFWKPGVSPWSQRVKATATDLQSQPVFFNANLSLAKEVAYDPQGRGAGDSDQMGGVSTVQEGLDKLDDIKVNKYGEEHMTGPLTIEQTLTVLGEVIVKDVEAQPGNVWLGDHDDDTITIHGRLRFSRGLEDQQGQTYPALIVEDDLRIGDGIAGHKYVKIVTTPTDGVIKFLDQEDSVLWELRDDNGDLRINEGDDTDTRLTILSGGKVGIGTTTPVEPLTIRAKGDHEGLIAFEDASGAVKWHISQNFSGRPGLNFAETGVADGRLFIEAGGNVGLGTTGPEQKLIVSDGKVGIGYNEPAQTAALAVAGSVGIGTEEPKQKLVVTGGKVGIGYNDAAQAAALAVNGKVGIGIMAPNATLHISNGKDIKRRDRFSGYLVIGSVNDRNIVMDNNEITARNADEVSPLHFQADGGDLVVHHHRPVWMEFVIKDSGKVGIGTKDPATKLHIASGKDVKRERIKLKDRSSGYLVIGSVSARNIVMDDNEITARNADRVSPLHFQADGGDLVVHYHQSVEKEFVIKDSGNVGLGIKEPKQKFVVSDGKVGIGYNDAAQTAALAVNGSVGIGTKDPGEKLTVYGVIESKSGGFKFPDGTIQLSAGEVGLWRRAEEDIYYDAGNVGIGTTSPEEKLHIAGGGIGLNNNESIWWKTSYGIMSNVLWMDMDNRTRIRGLGGGFQINDSGGNSQVFVSNTGNVGIGTMTPSERLEVVGTVKATAFVGDGSGLSGVVGSGDPSFGSSAASPNNAVFVNDDGNVGIGTGSPDVKLEVTDHGDYAANVGQILLRDPDNVQRGLTLGFAQKPGVGIWGFIQTMPETIAVGGGYLTNLLLQPNGGNVGIGTTTPGHKLEVNGKLWVRGWGSVGSDYGEYFESQNGNAILAGTAVVLENGKARRANKNETPIGIVSANPGMAGGVHVEWPEKYLRDEFGGQIMEEYEEEVIVPKKEKVTRESQKVEKKKIEEEVIRAEVVKKGRKYVQQEITETVSHEVEEPVFKEVNLYDETGKKLIGKHRIPVMETYEEEIDVLDEEGNPVMVGTGEFVTRERPKLNPDYDESKEYISREDRPEWNCVGLLGQLPLRKGQPVAPSWVKIKDISEEVELWLVK